MQKSHGSLRVCWAQLMRLNMKGKGSRPTASSPDGSQDGSAVSTERSTSISAEELSISAASTKNEKQEPPMVLRGSAASTESTSRFQFALIVLALCLAIFLVALVRPMFFNPPSRSREILPPPLSLTVQLVGQSDNFDRHPDHHQHVSHSRRRCVVRLVLPLYDLLLSACLWQSIYLLLTKACLHLRHFPF